MFQGQYGGDLSVLDAADPNRPVQLCVLGPANGGRFITATKIAFWSGRYLGNADLASGTVNMTRQLRDDPSEVAFSADGTKFAYRVGGDTNGLSTHLVVAAQDRTLVTRPGIGGHGGGSDGPTAQLAFSADGRYLLSVDSLWANFASGSPNFLVYGMDGATVFESKVAAFGVWSPMGAKLYFAEDVRSGTVLSVHSWDPAGGDVPVVPGLARFNWPKISPDGQTVIFSSRDEAGLPHLGRLDLGTRAVSQPSQALSSGAVFVAADIIWFSEERPCDCGMGGPSTPDGKLLSRDLVSGREATVDFRVTTEGWVTGLVVDVWIA